MSHKSGELLQATACLGCREAALARPKIAVRATRPCILAKEEIVFGWYRCYGPSERRSIVQTVSQVNAGQAKTGPAVGDERRKTVTIVSERMKARKTGSYNVKSIDLDEA